MSALVVNRACRPNATSSRSRLTEVLVVDYR
jgi:hypothetical protein